MADAALRKLTSLENPFEEVLNGERPWSVRDIGTNTISGILNDLSTTDRTPSFLAGPKGLRGMDSLPTVPPTPLRKVRLAEFEPYLRSLADVIDKHQLNRALGLAAVEGIPQLGSSTDSLDLSTVGLPEFEDLTARIAAAGSGAGAAAIGSKGISKMQRTRMLSANAPPLSIVPAVFLNKEFDLSNPHIFNAVVEQPDQATATAGSDATAASIVSTATNRALQDKLTHYLDTIEVHLLKEISRRSSSFFSALSNLQNLHNETELCVAKIQSLRKSLATVSQKTAKNGLEVVRLKRRRGNLGILYGTVKLLIDIKQTQPMIQVLLGQSDYMGALDLIEDTSLALRGMESTAASAALMSPVSKDSRSSRSSPNEKDAKSPESKTESSATDTDAQNSQTLVQGVNMIRNHSIIPRNMDLRGVQSLVHLSSQLAELSRTVSTVMENELSNTLLSDLRESVHLMLSEAVSIVPDLAGSDSGDNQGRAISVMTAAGKLHQQAMLSKTPIYARIKNIANGIYTASTQATPTITPDLLLGEDKLRAKLTPVVLGLLRMDRLGSALHTYRDALMKEVKAFTKQHYPVITATTPSPSSSQMLNQDDPAAQAAQKKKDAQTALAKQLRSMTFGSFYGLLVRVYVTSLVILQRVEIVHEIVSGIVNDAQTRGIVIGSSSVSKVAVESTVQANPSVNDASARRKMLDDDDEFGSYADLFDASGDTLQKSRPRGEPIGSSPGGGVPALAKIPNSGGSGNAAMDASATASDSVFEGGVSTFVQMSAESSDVLFAAADLSHARCAKLVGVRSEQNAQLNPTDFYRLFGATWEFVMASETLCGRICFGLKGSLLTQAKAYIAHFHDEKCKQIAVLVENEQWVQAEVPMDFQRITDQLQSGEIGLGRKRESQTRRDSQSGADGHDRGDDLHHDDENEDKEDQGNDDEDGGEMDLTSAAALRTAAAEMAQYHAATATDKPAESKMLKCISVGGSKYYVVGSVLLFLKALTEYMRCAESLPALATDVLNRILEVLKLFNSRTCQVILGAGAMRSAGLKNITARHIALASQSLGMIVALLPAIKNGFGKLLPAKQGVLLGDFDRIVRDYREHQSELYGKLVSIMGERLALHSSKLVAINWDNPDPREISAEASVTVHMAVLVKETTTLHRVLSKYLAGETLRTIMGDIFRGYVKRLEEDLRKVELFSSSGKNRLLMDVQYFTQQLSALDGVEGPGSQLEVCVNNIKIRDRRAAPSKPGSAVTPTAKNTPADPKPQSQFASSFGRMLRNQNESLGPH